MGVSVYWPLCVFVCVSYQIRQGSGWGGRGQGSGGGGLVGNIGGGGLLKIRRLAPLCQLCKETLKMSNSSHHSCSTHWAPLA